LEHPLSSDNDNKNDDDNDGIGGIVFNESKSKSSSSVMQSENTLPDDNIEGENKSDNSTATLSSTAGAMKDDVHKEVLARKTSMVKSHMLLMKMLEVVIARRMTRKRMTRKRMRRMMRTMMTRRTRKGRKTTQMTRRSQLKSKARHQLSGRRTLTTRISLLIPRKSETKSRLTTMT
jgi:hypothetical protein